MDEVPVFILPCIHVGSGATLSGARIFNAVQNILLLERWLGLGSALTTPQTRFEEEIKQMLGIPEDVAMATLLTIGFRPKDPSTGPPGVGLWKRWSLVTAGGKLAAPPRQCA
jgi:hypothetical protein